MDEAAMRTSRFLLTQSGINAAFGLVVSIGLFLIGVPYAALWGVIAALLRFVPYLGVLLAMAMPAVVAAVQFDGWRPVLETVGLFVGVDVVTANVVEPLVVGHHTGVSSLALLVAALFWTWLWGPVGLLLSTPITVCLAVLGKHVPRLEFLTVILGDEPVLEPEVTLYQRLLAGDEDEASEIVERRLEAAPRAEVFDSVVMPALLLAARDRAADEISGEDHASILRATAEIVRRSADEPRDGAAVTDPSHRRRVVCVPARDATDALALEMLGQLVDRDGTAVEQTSSTPLVSEVVRAIDGNACDQVCIAALPPGGVAHARHLCKRLRARAPSLRIVVLRPQADGEAALALDGADAVVMSLAGACDAIDGAAAPIVVNAGP
jgi:hypothetical protein